jgi:hypothetical protein
VLGSILLILIAARIALPYFLLRLVNRELTQIHGYSGHVDDLDVALIRGAYTLKRVHLDKTGGKVPVPFFSADIFDLSLEWNSLFHGAFVGKITVRHPVLNFAKGPSEETSQTHIDKSWTTVLGDLMPLKLNRFEIFDGEIHYLDFYSHPKVNIFANHIHILAENLSNARHQKELLPSTVEGTADLYGGHALLHMKMDALNQEPTFDAKAELLSMDIARLNEFLQAYGKFDVRQGNLSIYTEAAAKDGLISGYSKPIIKDLKVVNWKEDKDHPLKLVWEGVISAAAWVFKNHPKDQLATRASFEGNIKNPDVNAWYVVGQVLHNAFIQALYPALENSININSVEKNQQAPTPLSKTFQQSAKNKKAAKDQAKK